ncbi:pyridine nucleotide-disulfide oxidoreductase [Desulfosarcina alkanivorans]|uniref:Pyridine nucleotide-disulfide oxidoreductase n=1 Tax=Desulfosarcina alkanivorans TaxID=571177 RepID=A0A5K7YKX3_9BACT|nr:FAD-dependent oxidoreductase [Desulfosarcina alkanivorans]BBO69055.1 pyridine nucleotide-disulfide oxidoreductase [Desulfosarcina alkanivorans]
MKKRLVLIGGGHAHMVTLASLGKLVEKGHGVTVIGPSAYHYYSGMGPGMLSGTYRPDEIRFATRHVVEKQGGTFLPGKAVRIDGERKTVILENGDAVPYDVLSCNAGSHVPEPAIDGDPGDIFTVKPIERLMEAKSRLVDHFGRHAPDVVVVGGGPSSAEVAGNVWQLATATGGHMPRITVCAGSAFMGRFPESVRRRIVGTLSRRGISIREGVYVNSVSGGTVTLDNGDALPADFIFLALGVTPSPIFGDSGIDTGPDGGLRVNRFLQSTQYPDIFGGGDCIFFQDQPLDKVGVYAVRQNPVLLNNITARLEGGDLMPFDPGGDYLLIFNLGGRVGVLKKRWMEFGGRPAFFIKDYIDRKFMKEFQAIE